MSVRGAAILLWAAATVASCGGLVGRDEPLATGDDGAAGAAGDGAPVGPAAGSGVRAEGGAASAGAGPADAGTEGGAAGSAAGSGGWAGSSTGGGVSPGGDAGRGGSAGVGGEAGGRPSLDGNYDVWLASIPSVPGCDSALTDRHLNLQIDSVLDYAPTLFTDYNWHYPSAELTAQRDVLLVMPTADGDPALPTVQLDVGRSGFVGTGTAEVPLRCEDGTSTTATVAVDIGPDMTSPRVRPDRTDHGPYYFPWSILLFHFSEPIPGVAMGGIRGFSDPDTLERTVALADLADGSRIGTSVRQWPWGPPVGVVFIDPAAMVGRSFVVEVIDAAADSAGNPLVGDPEASYVLDAGQPMATIDFDSGPHPGAHGATTYYPPGVPGAPCEAGGCLALEGPVQRCTEVMELGPASLLAFRLDASTASTWRMRYRIWSSSESAPVVVVSVASGAHYGAGCGVRSDLEPLAQPDGVYTHATAWLDFNGGFSLPVDESGLVATPGCLCDSAPQPPPAAVRVVIEWVEVVP